jgi:hypothetical protein
VGRELAPELAGGRVRAVAHQGGPLTQGLAEPPEPPVQTVGIEGEDLPVGEEVALGEALVGVGERPLEDLVGP